MPTQREIERLLIDEEIARRKAVGNFSYFCKLAWHIVEPTVPYVGNWHVDAIGEHLEAVLNLQIRDLVINMPPRCSKSTLISVMFPAWCWLRQPGKKFLYSAYADTLSVRDSIKCRRLIESDWYRSFFKPTWEMNKDQNRQDEFSNTEQGYRIATSVGGAGTGKGGDIVVCDDPHKATEVFSDAKRNSVLEWWDFEMSTRSINPKTVARILVMQRLHPKDLSGHVLERGGYDHLVLPMEYEGQKKVTSIGWQDPREQIGELLSPQRFGDAEIITLKRDLGAHGYAGQMQQRPTAIEGGIIKRAWFKWYDPNNPPWDLTQHVQAWDFAASEKNSADYTVGGAAARRQAGVYIVDWVRDRVEFPAALQMFRAFVSKHPKALKKKVENKSNGTAVLQTVKLTIPGVVEVNPTNDKTSRLVAVSPFVEAGNVYLPTGAPWVNDFVNEVCGFSGEGSGHDDQVDVFTMLLDEYLSQPAPYMPTAVGYNKGY